MIHIALTIDENYVRYCTVVMASILENNKMDDITFHIVANDLTSNSKTIIFNQVKNSKALVSFILCHRFCSKLINLNGGISVFL